MDTELPDSFSKMLLRWVFHFSLGVLFSLPLAVVIFGAAGLSPTADLLKVACWVALLICAPFGLVTWLLGLIRRGEVLYWLISFLGIKMWF